MADEETQKCIVAFIFILQEGYFDVEQDEGPPKRKKRKIWVREWLRRRLDADTDTMFTLQRELSFRSKVVCLRLLVCLQVENMPISMIYGDVIIG